jgi:hypothetical protein
MMPIASSLQHAPTTSGSRKGNVAADTFRAVARRIGSAIRALDDISTHRTPERREHSAGLPWILYVR